MKTKYVWLSILAVILSFIGGFFLANSLNRNEINALQAQNESLKNNAPKPGETSDASSLSDEEIKERIKEADSNPENFEYQKRLGMALYRYASFKQNAELMQEVSRILERAKDLNPKDYEVIIALGNVYFDIGYFKNDNSQFEKARDFYLKALEKDPKDVSVRTDFGLTYFLTTPPDIDKAISEFERSYQENPKHERTLQVLTEAYLKQDKIAEAEKILKELEAVNPNNQTLAGLKDKVSQAKTGLKQ